MTNKLTCVLLVDDNEADNYFHTRVLKKTGMELMVSITTNGQEALDYLLASRNDVSSDDKPVQPDLILLDLNMPVVNGWEFLDEYRNLPVKIAGKEVIIVLTTSHNPADEVRAETILGPGCYYLKPLTKEILDEILVRHFA